MKISAAALAVLFLLSAHGAAAAPGDMIYAVPSSRVRAHDTRLNLVCLGNGRRTVVFESGLGDWAPAWAIVQPRVAKFTRACSYDRAGAGFSDAGPMPRTAVQIAEELHAALSSAHVKGPYILVGSAFGGDPVRTFADLYAKDVAGLVLVDADASDLEPEALQDKDHEGNARGVKHMRDCRDAIEDGTAIPMAPPARRGQPPIACTDLLFRGLPEAMFSRALNARLLHMARTHAAMYDAFASELEEMAGNEDWLVKHRRSLGHRPVRILTSGQHAVGQAGGNPHLTPEERQYEDEVTKAQAGWLKLSSDAKQIFVHGSGEYIQFDRPDAVVAAIRDVYSRSK
jgi:pimeloyl-ACP methyl ester carboxylesterase